MRKSIIIIMGIAFLFISVGIYAGTEFADVIKMENSAYSKHKKGIVTFTHQKHFDGYGVTCGECHHDENNKPLDLKKGDNVQGCIECHKKPGRKPKRKSETPKPSKKELRDIKLQYHAESLHMNCKDCHKAYNKKNKTKTAPTTCGKCHPKK